MRPAVIAIVLVALAAGSGCGAMLRANAGPTVTADGDVGAEVGVELGTHWISTPIVAATVGLRVQAVALADEQLVLAGLALSASPFPRFYGGSTVFAERQAAGRPVDLCGFAGHAAAAMGASSDGTYGLRVGVGVGYGTGRALRAERARFLVAGGEVAWQGDYTDDGAGLDRRRQRVTASIYGQVSWIPAYELALDLGASGKD